MANHTVLRLAACLSVASALAWSQAIPQETAKTTASLEGKVVNQTNQAPLKKTKLTLRPSQSGKLVTVESDDTGNFAFPSIEPGRYTLTGERSGYARQSYGARTSTSNGVPLVFTAGQAVKDLLFKLVPNAMISGRVLDEDGDPVVCIVEVLRPGYAAGKKRWAEAGGATSGENGEYSFSVPPGRYLMAAIPRTTIVSEGGASKPPGDQPESTYGITFYPRSSDLVGAQAIDAVAGAEMRGMDLLLAKSKGFRVRGKATGGKPSLAILTPRDSELAAISPRMTKAQGDGSFEFAGVTPGRWLLRVAGESSIASLPVTVTDKHLEGLTVELGVMNELPATIQIESKDPISPKGVQIGIDGLEAKGLAGQGTAGEDGKVVFKMISPDVYRVVLSDAPAGMYIKNVRFGSQDVTDSGADMLGGITGSLDVRLASDGAEVTGTVVDADGKPMPATTVALVPKSGRYLLYKNDTTDQAGSFRLHSIAPGEYKLYAWEDVVHGAWFDEEVLKPLAGKAEAITVGANDRKTVSLKAIPVEAKR